MVSYSVLPVEVMAWAGLTHDNPVVNFYEEGVGVINDRLSTLNDEHASFSDIALAIERSL
jgi:hypothetical protein